MSLDTVRIASALRVLADAIEPTEIPGPGVPVGTPPTAEPAKRGRGRPVKGEETTAAPVASAQVPASSTTTATPAAVVADDPFASTPAPVEVPTATLDEVRAALTALRTATSQDIALGVLKSAGGADNLTALIAANYGKVVAAAAAKQAEYSKPVSTPTADPFDLTPVPEASSVAIVTIEDVKAVVVETQKRTSQDAAQKVVMSHGGKAALPTGGEGPSLKALPAAQYAATIAALKALPTTK